MKYELCRDGEPVRSNNIDLEWGRIDASELLYIAARCIRAVDLYERKKLFKFEDGRKDWMVSYSKYCRIKATCEELSSQNFELKRQINALIELKTPEGIFET